jgi:hypothetical protein
MWLFGIDLDQNFRGLFIKYLSRNGPSCGRSRMKKWPRGSRPQGHTVPPHGHPGRLLRGRTGEVDHSGPERPGPPACRPATTLPAQRKKPAMRRRPKD